MTGDDIEWWLEGIWYDLTDLSSADVPTLKLFVLFVALFFLWQLGRMVMRGLWSVVQPLLRIVWRIRDGAGAAALAGPATTVPAGQGAVARPGPHPAPYPARDP